MTTFVLYLPIIIKIRLPSGSEVKIALTSMYMNVYINTPAFDKNKAKGICGTNDGNRGRYLFFFPPSYFDSV